MLKRYFKTQTKIKETNIFVKKIKTSFLPNFRQTKSKVKIKMIVKGTGSKRKETVLKKPVTKTLSGLLNISKINWSNENIYISLGLNVKSVKFPKGLASGK
jgi:hypothetical protein